MSTEEVEVKAREMGWSPKEDFRGDPERWVDAETFVKRGEEMMPILKANNKKQAAKINELEKKLDDTTKLVTEATKTIEALKEFNTEATRAKAKEQEKDLKEKLKKAKEDDDVDLELELTDQLQETREALKQAEKAKGKPTPKVEEETPLATAEDQRIFKAWLEENDWFENDPAQRGFAVGYSEKLRKADPSLVGKKLLDKVTKEVKRVFGTQEEESVDRVEGGSPGGTGNTSKGKTYASMPKEAQEACDRYADRLVGEGKAFKTMAEHRAAYAQKYFSQE